MDISAKAIGICAATILIAALAACQGGPDPEESKLEITSGRSPDASVSGTVDYRERLNLSEGATLIVELRDVSYADASAPLIARQTISGPGQVPIGFKVEYSRADIDARSRYSISARIIESDGRLAFTNDTAYEVITHGKPDRVDMLLVLVEPPPELAGEGSDWRTWVEVPVRVISANLLPNEPETVLRIDYYQSTIEGCARPGSQNLELNGYDIKVTVTLMQPPPTPWAIDCDEQVVELDAIEHIRGPLETGQTYRVFANGRETTTFTLPDLGGRHTFIAESPVESTELVIRAGTPARHQLRVVSALPRGSSCSQFNGYETRRTNPNKIDLIVTHHEVADDMAVCTADYPLVETVVPLGDDLEPGAEYTVSVNSDTVTSFVAR